MKKGEPRLILSYIFVQKYRLVLTLRNGSEIRLETEILLPTAADKNVCYSRVMPE